MMLTWEAVTGVSVMLAIAGALNALILYKALSQFEERLITKLDQRYVLIGTCKLNEQKIDFELELLRKDVKDWQVARDNKDWRDNHAS
jgi:hypothetical protein